MPRIHLLGQVRAWHRHGPEIALGSPQQRTVLAVLALSPGRVVGVRELIDLLWPHDPPSAAANVVQTYLKRLRRSFEPDRPARQASTLLPTVGDGYELRVDPADTDLGRFRALTAAPGDDPTTTLISALDLWHGPPLAGTSLAGGPLATGLLAERTRAVGDCALAALADGRAADVVALVAKAAAANPLDESTHAHLMALHAATDNRAEAFAVYQRIRSALADDLGIDPGPALARAHADLLGDVGVEQASAVTASATLPPASPSFSGRRAELAELAGGGIVAITGMAGVGKTQLAARAGHELIAAGRVDRVLFVNLRGFHPDPDQPPASASAVLEQFLHLLGCDRIPPDLDQRADRFAALLRGSRTLVVLDNAADERQLRPLLVDEPGCVTLITSRRTLPRVRQLPLRVFTSEEAAELLRRSAGTDRVSAEPKAADDIARASGYLPLALGLAAARILASPEWTIADHVDPLLRRLADLRLPNAVQVSIDLSYESLSPAARRLLRLIAVHPGESVDVDAVAVLADSDADSAEAGLADLVTNSMLLRRSDRFELHDLVRAAAIARSHDEDRAADRQAALHRVFEHYTTLATAAAHTLNPARAADLPPRPAGTFRTSDPDLARAWLAAEHQNLMTVIDAAEPTTAIRLASAVAWDLNYTGCFHDALHANTTAHAAAVELGDRAAEANALRHLGMALIRLTRYQEAFSHLDRALTIYRDLGDRRNESATMQASAIAVDLLGRCAEAIELFHCVLDIERELGDPVRVSTVLNSLATVCRRTGRFAEAIAHQLAALDLDAHGDEQLTCIMQSNAAELHLLVGSPVDAEKAATQAVESSRRLGHRVQLIESLGTLGTAKVAMGDYENAIRHLNEAIAVAAELGARDHEATALNHLGFCLHHQGNPAAAVAWHRKALAIADEISDHLQQARAHEGIAMAPDSPDATEHRALAVRIYRKLGSAEADRLDT